MAITYVPHRWTYNAFVSFRGEDIRKSFIDHLFKDFRQKGIHSFRGDTQLPRGEEISSQLYKAIEESRFLIVIFSKNYASSSWCLRELVKILECKQKGEHKHELRIIFYDVKPNVVRKQTESFAEAFVKHEASDKTEVDKWRKALFMASNLSGWDLQDLVNGYESKLIDSISKEILGKLCDGPLHIGENLVGVDARLNNLNLLRIVGSGKVHMIGICGVGGIGKTTLAKTIYNLMYIHFEECSFLEDVQGSTKRHGLTHVVMQLINDIMKTTDVKISNISQAIMVMKQTIASRSILLVLDGVDHQEQLEALAGSRNWFYPGSLILFTSKDKRLLAHKVDEIYDMELLDDVEALELFSLYAFRQKQPTKHFIELADQVVDYVQGHPLALKVLGCFLYGETVHVWKSELDKLRTYPNMDIQQLLRLSFDGLDSIQQRVFLDIASYLIGKDKDFAASVLDSCNFFADTSIKALVDRSLITISSTMLLQMHNLIQCMAMEIVREESKQVGDRSRLWIQSEVCDALRRNKVSEAVEVLVLLIQRSSQNIHIDCKSFTVMKNLRILKIRYLESWRTFENQQKGSIVKFSGNLKFLSNELRLFYWQGYPFKFLPSKFYPENIVSIDMSYSRIKNLWTTPMCFKKLKWMTLRHCRHLTNLPDFTEIPDLEYLFLDGCVNLVEVHPSVGLLKRLIYLSLRNCYNLRSFPDKVQMDSLTTLIIWGCFKVEKWPKVLGKIKTLIELGVDLNAINEPPSILSSLSNLQTLLIRGRERIPSRRWNSEFRPSSLPSKLHHPQSFVIPSFASLHFLRHLHVINCNISEVSSDIFEAFSCLQELNLGGNSFTSLPSSLSQLNQLEYLDISDCEKLEVLPEIPPSVHNFTAWGCTSLHEVRRRLPITDPRGLQIYLFSCRKLVERHTIESLVSMLLPQGLNDFCENSDIHIHGSRIPRWLTHQSTGKGVTVVLPSSWCYNKFRGYVACVVFTPKKTYNCTEVDEYSTLRCSVNNFDGGHLHRKQSCGLSYEFVANSTRIVESDMIWLHYSKSKPNWMKAKNFITFSFTCPFLEVKQCGVRLFCDEDIQEDMDLSMTQDLSIPTQDGGVFDSNHEWVLGSIKDEFPRIVFR